MTNDRFNKTIETTLLFTEFNRKWKCKILQILTATAGMKMSFFNEKGIFRFKEISSLRINHTSIESKFPKRLESSPQRSFGLLYFLCPKTQTKGYQSFIFGPHILSKIKDSDEVH